MQPGDKCYLLTKTECLMPGVFVGSVSSPSGLEFYEVQSPSGKIYCAQPVNVFDEPTGHAMLINRRAEALRSEGYQISLRTDGTFRVYCPAKHGLTGGYIVREIIPGHFRCSCPAYDHDGECKHTFGVSDLLFQKAYEARQAGKTAHAETYHELACSIRYAPSIEERQEQQARRERVAANISRDF